MTAEGGYPVSEKLSAIERDGGCIEADIVNTVKQSSPATTGDAHVLVRFEDQAEKTFRLPAPVLLPLQEAVASCFAEELALHGLADNALSLRLIWKHEKGESHIADDATFAKAWQASGCDLGHALHLRICNNVHQLSSASKQLRTCETCGKEFASRNQLMRHVQRLGHYGDSNGNDVIKANSPSDLEKEVPVAVTDQKSQTTQLGNQAFDAYYSVQLNESFDPIRRLMHTAVPYCFRGVPGSLLCKTAFGLLHSLKGEGTSLAPAEGPGLWIPGRLECWALKSAGDKGWSLLQAAQDAGAVQRQEAASMIPPLLLEVESHHYVADLCAAPASKTLQLLDFMSIGVSPGEVPAGLLVANDDSFGRCSAATRRTYQHKLPASLLWLCGDARNFPTLHDHSGGRVRGARKIRFDRVLCDVPCSGDGRLRRSPGGWADWNPLHMLKLHYVQSAILKRGLTILRPGGRLLYSTCSMSPVENEAVVAAALELLGSGQVRLLPVEDWSHAEGLTSWTVPSPDFNRPPFLTFKSRDEVPQDLWCQNEGPLAPTMFPPHDESIRSALKLCVRISPLHGDFGGFFCALFEKVAAGPATRPGRSSQVADDDSGGANSKGRSSQTTNDDSCGADSKGLSVDLSPVARGAQKSRAKRSEHDAPNPVPPLLAVAEESALQWLLEWFGLHTDAALAQRHGVARFPAENVCQDPAVKGGLTLTSPSLGRLVLKHAHPRIIAGGMPLVAPSANMLDTAASASSQGLTVCNDAALFIAACATKQLARLPRCKFLELLDGGAIEDLEDAHLQHGPLVVALSDSDDANASISSCICMAAQLTIGGALVTTAGQVWRRSLLQLLIAQGSEANH